MSDTSIEYYEKYADEFVDSTLNADMSHLYWEFEKHLSDKCRILDLGCGSGRDSRYFSKKGYEVIAVDPSFAMCEKTREIAKVPVLKRKVEDLDFENEFDAVWACASLLHVSRDKQYDALKVISNVLKSNGIAYCSWKYGDGERCDNGRKFTDMNKELVYTLVNRIPEFTILKIWTTADVRNSENSQQWINILLEKNVK